MKANKDGAQVLLENENNLEAFIIPILTGYLADVIVVRLGIEML